MPVLIILILITLAAAQTIALIGSGPVALTLVARYLNEQNGTLSYSFKIVEKRDKYTASHLANTQRPQMLAIWKENYLKLPVAVRVELLQKGCFRTSPLIMAPAYCYTSTNPEEFPENLVFQFIMKDYEEILKRYIESKANKNQVEFISGEYRGIDDENVLIYHKASNKSFKLNCDVIIGADGASSTVRATVFKESVYKALPVPINYGGAITYKACFIINLRLTV